jgi:hypothetical protein
MLNPDRLKTPPQPLPESHIGTEPLSVTEQRQATLEREAMIQQFEEDIEANAKEQARDMALWAETLPDSTTQAKYFGNLRNRLLKGISRQRIEEMSVEARVRSARVMDEMRRVEMDQPTQNISFSDRFELAGALPKLMQEVERRQREANTINGEAVDITEGRDET